MRAKQLFIYTIDAFTNKPFQGNPAGVVLLDEFLPESIMQNIATELGYSNTAFVKISEAQNEIRWFTPVSEAPLCGHATIATLHLMSELSILEPSREIEFTSKSGVIKGRHEDGWYTLDFPKYEVEIVNAPDALLKSLQTTPVFVGQSANGYFVELQDADVLRSLQPDLELIKTLNVRAVTVTAKGEGEYDFFSRYFAPSVGINEDPVCASAHTRLIPYWAAKLSKNELFAYQASKRGGILRCSNLLNNRVLISGEAVTIMKSELLV